jgi:hypothetical protein
MAIELRHRTTITGGGVTLNTTAISRSGSGSVGIDETLPDAQAGVLTTRSDDNTGTITMGSGSHTIATGNVVDIYWAGGVQYGVTVGTVSTTSVPIDSGIGDNLPASTTAVTVVPQTTIGVAIDGDNTKLIAIMLETTNKAIRTAGHIQFLDASSAEIAEINLVANVPRVYDIEGGDSNPFSGNPITSCKASQGNVTADLGYTLKIVGVQDATP